MRHAIAALFVLLGASGLVLPVAFVAAAEIAARGGTP